MESHKVTGIITDINQYKNNATSYTLKSGTKITRLVDFNSLPIMTHYVVTLCYDIKKSNNPKYPDSNIIYDVKYNDFIKDIPLIRSFLMSKKLSKKTVERLINLFEAETIQVIVKDFEQVSNLDIDKKDMSTLEQIHNSDTMCKYQEFFSEHGIVFKSVWFSLIDAHFKGDTEEIRLRPYDLVIRCQLPFKIVDKIGVSLGFGLDEVRISLLADYIYKKSNENGKLYLTEGELEEFCKYSELEYDSEVINLVLKRLIKIVPIAEPYYTTYQFYEMEKYVENFCIDLMGTKPLVHDTYDPDKIKDIFPDISDEQMQAAYMLINNSISIITGRPGSGKTTVITCASTVLTDYVVFLGPTGTSVQNIEVSLKKLSKVKKIHNTKCKTIHSFIASHQKRDKKDNADVLIIPNKQEPNYHMPHTFFIDEMSMVSLDLFHQLILILQKYFKYRLVLLGDPDQLPSISGGKIFYDIITYSEIPRTDLQKVKRTNLKGIIENAKRVIEGKDIHPDQQSVVLLNTYSKEEIDKTVNALFKKFPKIDVHNSCILIPQKKGEISTRVYNRQLQNHYNLKGEPLCKNKYYEFRMGDKLINKKNQYDISIYNGSILSALEYSYKILIKDFGEPCYKLVVNNIDRGFHPIKMKSPDLPKRSNSEYHHNLKCMYHPYEDDLESGSEVFILKDKLKNLELGYSITIHSSQGKGYDYVIIILNKSMCRSLLTRKLLYTAITRARKKCIILSDTESLEYCKAIDKLRVTNLFQNHMNKIDQLEYIIDSIPLYIQNSRMKNILRALTLESTKRIYKSSSTLDDLPLKTFDNLVNGLLSGSPLVTNLFNLIQRMEYYENVVSDDFNGNEDNDLGELEDYEYHDNLEGDVIEI